MRMKRRREEEEEEEEERRKRRERGGTAQTEPTLRATKCGYFSLAGGRLQNYTAEWAQAP